MITENFPHIARTIKADESVEISGDVYIGHYCVLEPNVKIFSKGGRLIIGDRTAIRMSSTIWTDQERMVLGTDLEIGENCEISGNVGHGTKIGDNVIIKSSVNIGRNCIIGPNQFLEDLDLPDGSRFIDGKLEE